LIENKKKRKEEPPISQDTTSAGNTKQHKDLKKIKMLDDKGI